MQLRSTQSSIALTNLAAVTPTLLQQWSELETMIVKSLHSDVRSSLALLEGAAAEEAKQPIEMQLNPNVMSMCVDQARRLREAMVVSADEELHGLIQTAELLRTRFAELSNQETDALTADLQLELSNLRSTVIDFSEKVRVRKEDEARALEHQARLAKEFSDMRDTMSKFRDSESEHASALAREVKELESAAESRHANEAAALENELRNIRAVTAAEAERMGSQMLLKYREETDSAIEAVQASFTPLMQELVDEMGKTLPTEFDSIMKKVQEKTQANKERETQLREQIASLTVQIDAVRRVQATHNAMVARQSQNLTLTRTAETEELQRLKLRVRQLWMEREATAMEMGIPTHEIRIMKQEFLRKVLSVSQFDTRLETKLASIRRELWTRSQRTDAAAAAEEAARRYASETAHRLAVGKGTIVTGTGVGSNRILRGSTSIPTPNTPRGTALHDNILSSPMHMPVSARSSITASTHRSSVANTARTPGSTSHHLGITPTLSDIASSPLVSFGIRDDELSHQYTKQSVPTPTLYTNPTIHHTSSSIPMNMGGSLAERLTSPTYRM